MSTVPSAYLAPSLPAPSLRVVHDVKEERREQLRRNGNFSLSYHTLQEGLKYHHSDWGYIAYEKKWGYTFVLADPVVDPNYTEEALDDFLAHHKKPSFCQVSAPMARLLQDRGFLINEFGTEFEIDLSDYTISGKKKRHIKEATNRLRNLGMQVVERSISELDRSEVEAVSDTWRDGKVVKENETRFLSRGIVLEDEEDVRKFYLLDSDGSIVAYIYFDPIYQDDEVIGYLSNIKRHREDAPRDFDFAMTWHAIQQFQQEGKQILSLGMAPFYELEDTNPEFQPNKVTSYCLRKIYQHSKRTMLNFEGMAAHKRRYRGDSFKVYYASPARFNVLRLLTLGKVCRMF
ncbi:Phosphatidylglycerol lysyltransferase [Polystyrenella longa]|uniref:Phosphatidylglycerol lysyltransferase n=1 Tax=Polystyrenella longa TaxID=2528007 RepID=A0A518CIP0_9PLAN|nr:DUF2156 domain-containing protein [Polystyrenella longa]QDU79091.1 Phosphatidylglycerol lysyltransferase [Polystyrenella longa]